MSLELDVAVRVGSALALVFFNAVAASLIVDLARARSGIARDPVWSGPRVLRPLKDAVKLLSKEDTSRSAADRWLFRAAPVVVFAPTFLAIYPLALGGSARFGAGETGLLLAYGALALGPVGLLLTGVSAADQVAGRLEAMRAAVGRIACGVPLALSMLTPIMSAGSLAPTAVVTAQRGTWLFGLVPRWFALSPQMAAFGLFAASAYLLTGLPSRGAEGVAGTTAYSGARFAVMSLAEYTASFVVSALCVTVFLGGWLVPYLDRQPLAEALGPVVFLGKTYAVMYVLARVQTALPPPGPASRVSLAWTRLVPAALVWTFAYAVLARVVAL